MSNNYQAELITQHRQFEARVMKVTTAHGGFHTPRFMPVGTRAAVNCMTPEALQQSGSEIILGGNTFHMLCAPGMEVIQTAGGMHRFMAWDGPMLTDSGGFQVFSLSKRAKLCKINENGAIFKHPNTGASIALDPEISIQTQKIIGADIIMAFDQCTEDTASREAVELAMTRTHRWLQLSCEAHQRQPQTPYGYQQALFGIIQGAYFQDCREQSAEFVNQMPVDGIAIGGESVGFDMQKTQEIVQWVRPIIDKQKLRYTMGVGLMPQDIINVVREGIDIFDCVAPTRNARHGLLYCGELQPTADGWLRFVDAEGRSDAAKIHIKNSRYALDQEPIMPGCECHTCQNYTRSYLHYLHKQKSLAYYQLACTHNVTVMQQVCNALQKLIHDS